MSNGLKNNQYYKICVDAYHLVMVIYSYRLVKKRGDNLNVKKLKGKRVEKDFTQLSISKALGMNVLSYHRKEKGIREFSMEEIEKLSKILELSLIQANEIFFNNDLPNG
jgi:DNA-binding XRE family transcriptional regulator